MAGYHLVCLGWWSSTKVAGSRGWPDFGPDFAGCGVMLFRDTAIDMVPETLAILVLVLWHLYSAFSKYRSCDAFAILFQSSELIMLENDFGNGHSATVGCIVKELEIDSDKVQKITNHFVQQMRMYNVPLQYRQLSC